MWVRVLVSRGADVNLPTKNNNRDTARYLALTGRETGQRIAQNLIVSGAGVMLI